MRAAACRAFEFQFKSDFTLDHAIHGLLVSIG